MHKCSKHQGPHAQVIHMDLDHVINSTAVIGNMKLQSGDLLMLSALLLQPKTLSPFCLSISQRRFSFGFPGCFTQWICFFHITPVSLTPLTTGSRQGWTSALLGTEGSFPLLEALEVCGDQECSKQIHWFPETWQESAIPFSKLSCKADPGPWGRSGLHYSLAEAEVGLHQAPHLTLSCRTPAETITAQPRGGAEVWAGCARCPKGISGVGGAVGTMGASSTARGGLGCSLPAGRTQPCLLSEGGGTGGEEKQPFTRRARLEKACPEGVVRGGLQPRYFKSRSPSNALPWPAVPVEGSVHTL